MNVKKNYIFLTIGLVLSIISKVFQFGFQSKVGDCIVLFSAVFFVLAILFSFEKFNILFEKRETRLAGLMLIAFSCFTILSFQLMMIMLVGNNNVGGFIFLGPFVAFGGLFILNWIKYVN